MQLYDTYLYTTTVHRSRHPAVQQVFAGNVIFELIANTPVDDGLVKCWHGCLFRGAEGDGCRPLAAARKRRQNALEAFGADFNVWKNKRPALKIMQLKTDGPFRTGRKCVWLDSSLAGNRDGPGHQTEVNGIHHAEYGDACRGPITILMKACHFGELRPAKWKIRWACR